MCFQHPFLISKLDVRIFQIYHSYDPSPVPNVLFWTLRPFSEQHAIAIVFSSELSRISQMNIWLVNTRLSMLWRSCIHFHVQYVTKTFICEIKILTKFEIATLKVFFENQWIIWISLPQLFLNICVDCLQIHISSVTVDTLKFYNNDSSLLSHLFLNTRSRSKYISAGLVLFFFRWDKAVFYSSLKRPIHRITLKLNMKVEFFYW